MPFKPRNREEIITEGIEAMVRSMMSLIEPCIRQRCKQFVELIDDNLSKSTDRETS